MQAVDGMDTRHTIKRIEEPLIYCDSGMEGKASRSETRGLS